MSSTPPSTLSRASVTVLTLVASFTLLGVIWFQKSGSVPKPVQLQPQREFLRAQLQLRDGRLYHLAETNAFTGLMLERYPDGALQSRSAISNGLLHGLSEGWHTNGHLQVSENFAKGVSHGVRTKWYASGIHLSEVEIVNGQLQGIFRRWHENGAVAEEVKMDDGQPDGIAKSYFPDGSLKSETSLRDGVVIEQKLWKIGQSQTKGITTKSLPKESL